MAYKYGLCEEEFEEKNLKFFYIVNYNSEKTEM